MLTSSTLLLAALIAAPSLRAAEPPPVSPPSQVCGDPSLPDDAFCLPVAPLEQLLKSGELTVLESRPAPQGVSGATVLRLRATSPSYPDPIVIKAKWKVVPKGGGAFNNSPRRELAAYAAQALFLPPGEAVVPPTVLRCWDPDEHAALIGPGAPAFAGSTCVLGTLSYWLQNVRGEGFLDAARFETDPAFAEAISAFNLFTWFIDHRDSRDANFLRSADPVHPRILSVDNGLAFSGFRNTRGFYKLAGLPAEADFAQLQLDTLPRGLVERLRALTRADLDGLRVVVQLRLEDGQLLQVPPTAPMSRRGVSWDGETAQLGLKPSEVDRIERRIARLLARVDAGEITLF